MRNEMLSRRSLLGRAMITVAALPSFALVREATAAAPVPLDAADPTAKALAYTETSAKTDQKCANCAQFQGKASDSRAACSIFPGKTVAAAGWCSVWVKKPA